MSRRLRIEPEAEAELQAAAEWYEEQEPGLGLGFAFLEASRDAHALIEEGEHGTAVPRVETSARRVPIARFPLWIIFIELADEAVIVAYSHERRSPGYWLNRLRSS